MRRMGLAISILVFTAAVVARLLPTPRTIDDAFITFRYARNIVEGHGFLYNLGQPPTLGTTTPLFTLLMAAIGGVTGGQDFPWYALVVSALADGLLCILLYAILRHVTGHIGLSAIPSLLWAVAPRSVTFAVGGMETSLNLLWMVSATAVYVLPFRPWLARWRLILLGVLAALGVLTRIDSLIWIGPLFLAQMIGEYRTTARQGKPFIHRFPWQTWLAFGLTLLPWLIFSLVYFGVLFPRSLGAKSVAYIMPPNSAMILFIQSFATPFFEADGGVLIPVLGLLYLTLSLIGLLFALRHAPRLLPLLIYPWLYATVFSVANPLIFRWYLTPPLIGLMLGIFLGIWSILFSIAQRFRRNESSTLPLPAAGILAMIGLIWMATSLNSWELHPDHGPDRPAPAMAWHKIELLYQDVATDLRTNYGITETTLVASGDIGAVGYFSRATILDTVGLVTANVSGYYPVPAALIPEGQNYAIPPQLILDYQPEYLIAMESMVRLGLEQNETFRSDYRRIREVPTEFYGTGMLLYQRVE